MDYLPKNRAAFLDRDGVICEENHYISKPSQFRLLPKVGDAIRLLNEKGFKVVVITNQSGVARGYFTEKDLEQVHKKMKDDLCEKGAELDAIYFCPHHPDGKIDVYRGDCGYRKPKPSMLELAAAKLNLDLKQSFMIGDKLDDIIAGTKAGCKTILVLTGCGKSELNKARGKRN